MEPIIAPVVEAAGYRLVRLRLMGGKKKTLQVMAERPDGSMNVEDCIALSRALSDFLERRIRSKAITSWRSLRRASTGR